MWTSSLRSALSLRLAAWYFGISALGAVLVVALTYAMLVAALRERDRDAVRDLATRYGHLYARAGLAAVERAVAADRLTGRYEPFFLRVARGGESVLYLSLPADWRVTDLTMADRERLAAGDWVEIPSAGGEASFDVAGVRLPDGTEMHAGKSSRIRREALSRFRGRAFGILAVVFVATLAGGMLLTHSALAPLHAMTDTIRQILKTGTVTARVPAGASSDPLDSAARLFNDLLARLDRLMIGLRQALDNTAHDLRTPLTRIRARVETALQRPMDVAATSSALEHTLDEIDRIDQMLTMLMDISEAEAGAMRLTYASVDVHDLLEEAKNLYADVADARGLSMSADAPTDLAVDADRDRLRQVLANLLDNALKFTPAGGHVRLEASADDDNVVIRVVDTGRGITASELPRIWDRSFRGDQSRSERGYGLGLSLVKAIIDAHAGSVSAESHPGRGTTIALRLPRTSAPKSVTDVRLS